jgi:hypothetical protein
MLKYMKLYATTTSERASKGQGGNNFLNIDIFVGSTKNSIPFASFRVEKGVSPDTDKPAFILLENETGEIVRWQEIEEKGEKQKGESLCNFCGMGGYPCDCEE